VRRSQAKTTASCRRGGEFSRRLCTSSSFPPKISSLRHGETFVSYPATEPVGSKRASGAPAGRPFLAISQHTPLAQLLELTSTSESLQSALKSISGEESSS